VEVVTLASLKNLDFFTRMINNGEVTQRVLQYANISKIHGLTIKNLSLSQLFVILMILIMNMIQNIYYVRLTEKNKLKRLLEMKPI
jgi:hypothetical protein